MFDNEKISRRMDSMTDIIKDAFFSEDNRQLVISICGDYHLSDERTAGVGRSLGYLLLGLIFPKDLPSQIVKEANIDPRIAAEIAQEIDHKIILPPLAIELNKVYGFKLDIVDVPRMVLQTQVERVTAPTITEAEQVTQVEPPHQDIATVPIKSVPDQTQVAPLVMHKRLSSEPTPIQTGGGYPNGLVRPSFYTPETSNPNVDESTPVARLEIGINTPNEEPQTTRVGKEKAQVVHYSAPEVAPDPFSGTPKPTSKAEPKKNINPDNVVNLKDLPQ